MTKQQKGTSLIEILVAVLVLAIGLLGVAGMQMSALRSNQAAYQRSIASVLANAIVERMSANRDAALAGDYNLVAGAPGCAAPSAGAALATQDLADWINNMQGDGMLGSLSCGGVDCVGATGICEIKVVWKDERSAPTAETLEMVLEAQP